jgi:GntR family transcriptional regulator
MMTAVAAEGGAMTPLTRDIGAPLHHQIAAVLRSAIASGRYGPSDYLPGETTLMEMFGVSRATVRRALSTLEAEHLVDRRPGKGTRVLEPAARTPIQEHLRQIERCTRHTTVDVLEFGPALAPCEATRALGLPGGSRTLKIVRLRRHGDLPLRHLTNFIEPAVGERLTRTDVQKGTLTRALGRIGHTVHRAEDEVGATLADPLVAGALQVRVGDPLLEMARTMYGADGEPIAFQWTLVPPDRFRLRIVISGGAVSSVSDYCVFAPLAAEPERGEAGVRRAGA